MFKYKQQVLVKNDGFYDNVVCVVLDKRLYNNEVQYFVNLDPPRWLSERKLTALVNDLKSEDL